MAFKITVFFCGTVVKEKIRKHSCHGEEKSRASKVVERALNIHATTLVSSDSKQFVENDFVNREQIPNNIEL